MMLSFPETKNGEARTAVVAERRAIESLRRYQQAYPMKAGILFPAQRGEGPLSYQTLWQMVNRAAGRAGIWERDENGKKVGKRIYPYLFRHTWNMIEGARMPQHLRSAQTGTTSETILAYYDHVGAPQLLQWYQEHGEGAPVISDEATETLREVRDQLEALSSKDAALAEALKETWGRCLSLK